MLTSYFKITKSQIFGIVVNFVSMYSIFSLNSLFLFILEIYLHLFFMIEDIIKVTFQKKKNENVVDIFVNTLE